MDSLNVDIVLVWVCHVWSRFYVHQSFVIDKDCFEKDLLKISIYLFLSHLYTFIDFSKLGLWFWRLCFVPVEKSCKWSTYLAVPFWFYTFLPYWSAGGLFNLRYQIILWISDFWRKQPFLMLWDLSSLTCFFKGI